MRRIDASTLFLPTNQGTTTAPPARIEDARLPPPFISFTASPCPDFGSRFLDFFAMFGRGETKSLVAGADENGFTVMYDLDQRNIYHHCRLNEPKLLLDAVSLAVGDALYVMDRVPVVHNRCGFEALVYDGKPSNYEESIEDWRWHCLEPPPFVLTPGYKPTRISAYTVVSGSDIWISSPDIGTYSFNTSSCTWRKAGRWVLPFRDRADYIPGCNSWLGFTSRDGLLCSLDLSTASGRTKPVVSRYARVSRMHRE
jgi:hypothetical protein